MLALIEAIKKQQKFYSLPKRYNKIQRFEQWKGVFSKRIR
jgi:hypothetical protein